MAQEQNNQQGYTCTGDCLRCSQAQRQYCASQFTFKNMRMLEGMVVSLQLLSAEVKNLSEKVEAIQNAEGEIINPTLKDWEENQTLKGQEQNEERKSATKEPSAITASGA